MAVPTFEVLTLGIILDSTKKKILIGRREDDPNVPRLSWCFPGGRVQAGEDLDDALKRNVERKTGYKVKNIGTFFSRNAEERPEQIEIMFLTRVFEGEEKPGDDLVELKWVSPKEIENYFETSIHKKLKEFLLELI